jgi:hypothetical protein
MVSSGFAEVAYLMGQDMPRMALEILHRKKGVWVSQWVHRTYRDVGADRNRKSE